MTGSTPSAARSAYRILTFFLAGCASEASALPHTQATVGSVNILSEDGISDAHLRTKVDAAASLLNQILNDRIFRDELRRGPSLQEVSATLIATSDVHNNEHTRLSESSTYAWNMDGHKHVFSNEEVAALLLRAREPLGKLDGVLEFGIRRNLRPWTLWCGWPFYREVGHRDRDVPNIIVTQDCKMDAMSVTELAAHWLHEYMHMLGFEHSYDDDALRKFSVPYFAQHLLEERTKDRSR